MFNYSWPEKNDESKFPELEEDSPELNKMIGWNACHDAFMAVIEGKKECACKTTPIVDGKCVFCGKPCKQNETDEVEELAKHLSTVRQFMRPENNVDYTEAKYLIRLGYRKENK